MPANNSAPPVSPLAAASDIVQHHPVGTVHGSVRPAPAPWDVFHELRGVLSRIKALLSCAHVATRGHIFMLDGWIPSRAPPDPVLAALTHDLVRVATRSVSISAHDILVLRSSADLSYERSLEAAVDSDAAGSSGPLLTLDDVYLIQARLAGVCHGYTHPSPFPRGRCMVLDIAEFADDNPAEFPAYLKSLSALDPLFSSE